MSTYTLQTPTILLTNTLTAHFSPLYLQETEEEKEEEEDEESSSESGESSTPAPTVVNPVVITDAPVPETTVEPIVPTIVTDTARGDNLGGPSDYKSIIYVEEKSYHKIPVPYKSYEFVGAGKKMAYDMTDGNEVEKSVKVQKVHVCLNSQSARSTV